MSELMQVTGVSISGKRRWEIRNKPRINRAFPTFSQKRENERVPKAVALTPGKRHWRARKRGIAGELGMNVFTWQSCALTRSLLWETKSGFHGNSVGEDRARKGEEDRKDCGSCSYSNACLTACSGRHGYDCVHASVREHCCLGCVNIFVDLDYQPTSNHTLNTSKTH